MSDFTCSRSFLQKLQRWSSLCDSPDIPTIAVTANSALANEPTRSSLKTPLAKRRVQVEQRATCQGVHAGLGRKGSLCAAGKLRELEQSR